MTASHPSNAVVRIGLIVTEPMINALKYAFTDDRPNSSIDVTYEVAEASWRLAVSGNGIGQAANKSVKTTPGLRAVVFGGHEPYDDHCRAIVFIVA
jgi:two-component sensor histidine kinase